MHVTDLLGKDGRTAFSIEVLPPIKGQSIERLFSTLDALREFDPSYVNITTHRSEYVYREVEGGLMQRQRIRRRPGTIAIAAAIQARYGMNVVPHVVCSGMTRDDIEYNLIDLQYLGIRDLLLLRGDKAREDSRFVPTEGGYSHAIELQRQVNQFNAGVYADGSPIPDKHPAFEYGVACYPEKHEEAPNMVADLMRLKEKADAGASYAVTQLFFDNEKYFDFVRRAREAGVTIPIIPGIKPFAKLTQLEMVPKTFHCDIPDALYAELSRCRTNEDVEAVGTEWTIGQCRELMAHGVPGLHFYTLSAVNVIRNVAKEIF